MLRFRSGVLAAIRDFFSSRGYLEADTPALAPAPIPESCLEVFRTEYLRPFREGASARVPLFLLPSPELYLKKLLAAHRVSVFQISKCYRNCESVGKLHSPEFTMLEYYQVGANEEEMRRVTEDLIAHIEKRTRNAGFPSPALSLPFRSMSADEAFSLHTGVSLSEAGAGKTEADFRAALHGKLLERAVAEGLGEAQNLARLSLHDLYDILFIQCVEPAIAGGAPLFLTDYPAFVPALAQGNPPEAGNAYRTRARWELYAAGIELANCYTEERDRAAVEAFFREEGALKARARVPHPAAEDFAATCAAMPPCSGVAMGVDRLVMLLAGKKSIDGVLPFPLELDVE